MLSATDFLTSLEVAQRFASVDVHEHHPIAKRHPPRTSDGFNLIGNNSGAISTPAQFSDQLGVTAVQLNLGSLQDNGGPTQTHALLSGSFATDKGHSSGAATDQRGFVRLLMWRTP